MRNLDIGTKANCVKTASYSILKRIDEIPKNRWRLGISLADRFQGGPRVKLIRSAPKKLTVVYGEITVTLTVDPDKAGKIFTKEDNRIQFEALVQELCKDSRIKAVILAAV